MSSSDAKMTDITPINIISDKFQTLQVPDINPDTCEYLKDGKLNFNEPKLRAENHAQIASKIISFRMFRAHLENTAEMYQPTIEISEENMDIIAALVQDSDEPLKILVTRINEVLSPFQRNEKLANKFDLAIEKAVKQVAQKCTYGLKQDIYLSIEHNSPNVPWHLNIVRWEVENLELIPPEIQQAVLARRNSRIQMTELVSHFIFNLPAEERSTIVNTKHRRPAIMYKESIFEDNKSKQSIETEQEKKLKREEEKKRKDDEKRQKEEEKRIKDEERKQREEEKRRIREEERKVKEEEKRHKEEEKRKREEEKKKKDQSQLRLTSLFAKTITPEATPHIEQKTIEPTKPTLFPAFYIKDHVTIASSNPHINNKDSNNSSLDSFIQAINSQPTVSIHDFTSNLSPEVKQKRGISIHVDIRTLLLPGSADIMHVPNVRSVLRMKLLQFSENVRPAYYGTYTKRSRIVHGRRPFAQDTDLLDYEVDSEAEWEPEGEGEDINSGDEEDDDPNEVIDPEDAGWLVPEGYLSDSEGVEDGDERDRVMKHQHKTNTKKGAIRKIVLGPFFEGETEDDEVLKPFETQFFIDVGEDGYNPFYKEPTTRTTTAVNTTANNTSSTKVEFTAEHTNALINLINDNSKDSIPNLINEAKANSILKDVSKRQLEARIKDIAVKEKRGSDTRPSWYIKDPANAPKPQ